MRIGIGDPIPDATLLRPDGGEVRLREVAAGRPLVVAFYPKDFSPVCSIEARRFRDDYGFLAGLAGQIDIRQDRAREVQQTLVDTESSAIPYTELYRYPSPKEWAELTARRRKFEMTTS